MIPVLPADFPTNVKFFKVGGGVLWVALNDNGLAIALAFQPNPVTVKGEKSSMTNCFYNGEEFSPGSVKCQDGKLMQCADNGSWTQIGACFEPASGLNPPGIALAQGLTCCSLIPDGDPQHVTIYNKCEQCMILRISWTGTPQPGGSTGFKDYQVQPHTGLTILVESALGIPVEEFPCPKEFHLTQGTPVEP